MPFRFFTKKCHAPVSAAISAVTPVAGTDETLCLRRPEVVPQAIQRIQEHKATVIEVSELWQLKHMSLVGCIGFLPEVAEEAQQEVQSEGWDESAFIRSYEYDDEASTESVAPVGEVAAPKESLNLPTTDSWLANEFPSLYCKADLEDSDSEDEGDDEIEECSPVSSTETLVAEEPKIEDAGVPKVIEIVEEVPERKIHTIRRPHLYPLHLAQKHYLIKYRPEGFEMAEARAMGKARAWWVSS
jgi:hypothetical protein